jgi:hypothetical protein
MNPLHRAMVRELAAEFGPELAALSAAAARFKDAAASRPGAFAEIAWGRMMVAAAGVGRVLRDWSVLGMGLADLELGADRPDLARLCDLAGLLFPVPLTEDVNAASRELRAAALAVD